MADTKGATATSKGRDRSGEKRERFKGLVIKNVPTKTSAAAKAKLAIASGTDVDRLVDDIRKGLAKAREADDSIKFVKGTLTLS